MAKFSANMRDDPQVMTNTMAECFHRFNWEYYHAMF